MSRRTRRIYSPSFKAKVALAAVRIDGKGPLDGQRVRGASVAQSEAGRSLPARVRDGRRVQEGECADYLRYFNQERPHQELDNRTPDDIFYKRKPLPIAA